MKKPSGPRAFNPRLPKPAACSGCPLEHRGPGYVPYSGPLTSPLAFIGEGPWYDEVASGAPMTGASGAMLQRILRILGRQREEFLVDNVTRCACPSGSLDKWTGAEEILAKCQYWIETLRQAPHAVIVPMGGIALRRVLGLPKSHKVRVQDFHGTVQQDAFGRWVVPTYHPAHLVRGAANLTNVVAFDISRALEVAAGKYVPDVEDLILDPPLDWFRAWVDQHLAAVRQDPSAFWLSADIETKEGTATKGESLTAAKDDSYTILRVNFANHPEEGLTVPFEGPYIGEITRLLEGSPAQLYWFKGYDRPRLLAAGINLPDLACYDGMWAWKALQADLPMGLGHAAPFYVKGPAWKHLSQDRPAEYGARDGVRNYKTVLGILRDLHQQGREQVFYRHQHAFHAYVLQPATDVGVAIDPERLTEFGAKLDTTARENLKLIQAHVPDALRPLTPKGGMKTRPAHLHDKARELTVKGAPKAEAPDPIKAEVYASAEIIEQLTLVEVQVCQACGKQEIAKTHRCEDRALTPNVVKAVVSLPRFFWKEPFNPDSPPQLLALGKACGLEPGKDKKTGNDSVGREVLQKWHRALLDQKNPALRQVAPAIKATLDYKAVSKVRGTYVIGMRKRLDANDRVHPETTFKPNTMRTSQVNPNLQNVIADKGGKESIAAGFRYCVVARGRWVEAGSEYADG